MVVAVFAKLVGCGLGARWAGMGWREALAIGSGMIAKGTMGIILAILAMQHKLIGERMFVAIVVVSLLTSVLSGPMIQFVLNRR
jgi:Kef-type K+ transport system membrane component KefB